jgi:hypothetical protein
METDGLPQGREEYVRAPQNRVLRQLLEEGELDQLLEADAQGEAIVRRFLEWMSRRQAGQLANALRQLDAAQLLNFDAAVGAARLTAFVRECEANKHRADEDYWQQLFTKNSWAISQLFATPLILIRGQAYVGGKGIDNRDGNIADFLYGNPLTGDAALVEIKTPAADLLAKDKYRNNTWYPSKELSGGTQQLLTNKHVLIQDYHSLLKEDEPPAFKAFNSRALLVIGSISRELKEQSKRRCFELHRRNLRDVEVVTFDEVHAKARQLIQLLEAP